MKTTKAKNEFKKGKHGIGWVDSDFTDLYGEQDVKPGTVLPFKKLERYMTGDEILGDKEVFQGECELGDILATLDTATDEMKDGYANLFYVKGSSRVVDVHWFVGGWVVGGWPRGDGWRAGRRVFSLATDSRSSDSGTRDLELETAITKVKEAGYVIFKPV